MTHIAPYRGFSIEQYGSRGHTGYQVVEPPDDKRTGGLMVANGLASVVAAQARVDTIIEKRITNRRN